MGNIEAIEVEGERILAKISLSKREYEALNSATSDILLVPVGDASMPLGLTLGRIGNGNRMMLPNKILKAEGITRLPKKAPARIVTLHGKKYIAACINGNLATPFFDLKPAAERGTRK